MWMDVADTTSAPFPGDVGHTQDLKSSMSISNTQSCHWIQHVFNSKGFLGIERPWQNVVFLCGFLRRYNLKPRS